MEGYGLLALEMAARATLPILQVENLSHGYWGDQPRACSQPTGGGGMAGRGQARQALLSEGWEPAVNHNVLHKCSGPGVASSLSNLGTTAIYLLPQRGWCF